MSQCVVLREDFPDIRHLAKANVKDFHNWIKNKYTSNTAKNIGTLQPRFSAPALTADGYGSPAVL